MEITDFFTKDVLASFSGTLIAVELVVFVTKDFPLIKKIPTKFYTFMLAVLHLIIVKATCNTIDLSIECFYRLFINALAVDLILCSGYDTLMEKLNGIKKNIEKTEEDIAEINGVISNETTTNNADANNTTSENAEEDSKKATSDIEK